MFFMIELKSPREIEKMRAAGRIVAETYEILAEAIQPGVSLRELDRLAENFLRSQGAEPLYKGYRGSAEANPPFPGVICASVNEEVCHGLPDGRRLHKGDIVSIDIGLRYRGYCGDACVTYPVGEISPQAQRLLEIARESLRVGIEAAQPSNHLHDIGATIEAYARPFKVGIVRDRVGHGIGKKLHEAPSVVHVRQSGRGPKLRPGMVFTIEPMINLGTHRLRTLDDGWTDVTADGSLSAQFEHTVAITENGSEILTRL